MAGKVKRREQKPIRRPFVIRLFQNDGVWHMAFGEKPNRPRVSLGTEDIGVARQKLRDYLISYRPPDD